MTRTELLAFLRRHRYCAEASVAASGMPQAAVVGYATSDRLELVFDTLGSTRKMRNLRRDGRVALVIWGDEQTVQLEGVADEPSGAELERLQAVYFDAFPDGRERQAWEGITWVRVRPSWARYSDFRPGGTIVELDAAVLGAPAPVDPAARLAAALRKLTPESPEAIDALSALYADDIVFRDPIQEVRGKEAFLALNRRMIGRMRSLEWTVNFARGDAESVILEWKVSGKTKMGLRVTVDGMTRARLRDGLVFDHRDYWDMGELMASPLPGGQRLLRAMRIPFA
jgi:hypothetical protein